MKVLAAVLVLTAVAVVGLAAFAMLNLGALVGAHRDALVARVARVIGRPVTVDAVVPSWWPLGIRLRHVTIGEDPAFGTGTFLAADGVVLSVRPWPLVQGRIEAAGLVLDRPELTLRREGGTWNVTTLGSEPEEPKTRDDKGKERRRGIRVPLEWAVGVALSQVRDGTIVLEAGPQARIVLRHVHLRADDVRLGAAARVRLEAAVFGTDAADVLLDLRVPNLGQHDVEHTSFTARLALTGADTATVSGWLGQTDGARGRVDAITIDASGTLEALHATLDVRAEDRALRIAGLPLGDLGSLALQGRAARAGGAVTIESLRATAGAFVLEAKGTVAEDPWRVVLDLATPSSGDVVPVAVGSTTVELGAVDGHVAVDREGAKLDPLRATIGGVMLEAHGWVTDTAPPVLDVHVDGRPFSGTLAADVTL